MVLFLLEHFKIFDLILLIDRPPNIDPGIFRIFPDFFPDFFTGTNKSKNGLYGKEESPISLKQWKNV